MEKIYLIHEKKRKATAETTEEQAATSNGDTDELANLQEV